MAASHADLHVSPLLSCAIILVSLHFTLVLSSSSMQASTSSSTLVHTNDYTDPPAKSTPTMNPPELEALYQVMEAIAGAQSNWRAQHPVPCSAWPGVVCEQIKEKNNSSDDDDEDTNATIMHVTRLDLGYKPNPTCMANATLHPSIGKLPYLQSLFIFGCFTDGNATIPPEIGLLAGSLQELSLRSNPALVGEIPAELGALTSLQVLSLSQNSLYGNIPPSIGKLRSLEHLDLSYNMLSGYVPQEIGALKSLVIMDLSMNALVGPIPASMGGLISIQKMDVSYNALEGAVPMELGKLKSLQFLSISDNALTGPLPASFANFSTNLQYLILDNNPISGPIPSFLAQFSNLLALSLSNSGYFGFIPESLGTLANLSVLSLDRNNLSGPIPQGLAQLPHLYSLNLSQNCLSGPVPFTPAFIHKLGKNLDLQGNEGLCSHWALPQNNTTGEIMRLCSELNGSAYSSISNASQRSSSSEAHFVVYFCNLTAILLSWWFNDPQY